MKNFPKIVIGVVVLLVAVIGFLIWQKSQVKPPAVQTVAKVEVKKVDLSTQPDWVQKLVVTAVSGHNVKNGLKTYTITIQGIPKGLVTKLEYVIQFMTTNKGSQGDLSSRPVELNGAIEFSHTGDFGTCSTKSCIIWEGVKEIDIELDFIASDGSTPVWSKTLNLK